MKNERTPRVLADTVFRTSYPYAMPTRRARVLEKIGGGAVIVALILFTAWTITGA
jgi:hypothetical protein